ncbi:MAG: PTS transporter subunit EIIC [Serratia sp. (in: enterobacteria)]|uniref:PTS transporter subunit EIIC n=1 Tax=Serratia sp. (in: enterobacteria) TaxID=616 RepID=UPI003F41843E
MGKYSEMSRLAVEFLGGVENIMHVTHCATRLRIDVAKKSSVNVEALKQLPDCAGIVNKQNQIQIIIGPNVNDAFNDFIDVSKWKPSGNVEHAIAEDSDEPHNANYYLNKFGNFVSPIFMPVVPAMIVGGMILAIRNLLMNYFGMDINSGTANILLAIFQAGFTFLPIYIGYTLASQLKMQPIMGAFLGAVLLTERINDVAGLNFIGINIPQISYGSTILPVILGVFFMYYVDKLLKKIIPESLIYFVKPLLTMAIVVPVQLIVLGPLGMHMSGAIGNFCIWLGDTVGFLSQPILAAVYPYMVMLGIDKAISPISIQLISTLGYNPVTGTMGFISNLCIGASALAVATSIKDNKAQKGMIASFGITALCGVTEPAFYGSLISRPKVLIGTAIGAMSGGLVAGLMGLRSFVEGGCPGLLTFLFFVDKSGSLHYVIIAAIVAAVSIVVSFLSVRLILSMDAKKSKPVVASAY